MLSSEELRRQPVRQPLGIFGGIFRDRSDAQDDTRYRRRRAARVGDPGLRLGDIGIRNRSDFAPLLIFTQQLRREVAGESGNAQVVVRLLQATTALHASELACIPDRWAAPGDR